MAGRVSGGGLRRPAVRDGQRLERSRLQLHLKSAGTENLPILDVNVSAANRPLPIYTVSKSIFCTPYRVNIAELYPYDRALKSELQALKSPSTDR